MLLLFSNGAGGKWQFDDANQTDYPIITTNLVSGQRDYAFTTDESGNIILDIYKVQAKDTAGVYHDLIPVDQQSDTLSTMTDGSDTTGTPTHYDKTGNGIFLDLVSSYNYKDGLRVFINREALHFSATGDEDVVFGFTGIYHEYLVLYASYQYARTKGLLNRETFKRDLLEMEEKIKRHAGTRERDVVRKMKFSVENNK